VKELLQQQARRERRVERYEEIRRLRAEGHSISAIARRLGMQRATVRMFLRADEYPEARRGSQPSKVQPFAEYLKERWLAGCHNARQLYREITARGYRGHVQVLQAYLEPWREILPERRSGVGRVVHSSRRQRRRRVQELCQRLTPRSGGGAGGNEIGLEQRADGRASESVKVAQATNVRAREVRSSESAGLIRRIKTIMVESGRSM
jgi:Helix-turn-helix domain of resolvase